MLLPSMTIVLSTLRQKLRHSLAYPNLQAQQVQYYAREEYQNGYEAQTLAGPAIPLA